MNRSLLTMLNSVGIFVEDPRALNIDTVVEDTRTCTACEKLYMVSGPAWVILASRSEVGRAQLENVSTMHRDVRLCLLRGNCPDCAS